MAKKAKKSKGIKERLAKAMKPKARVEVEPLGKTGIAIKAAAPPEPVPPVKAAPIARDPNIPPWARKTRGFRRATRR